MKHLFSFCIAFLLADFSILAQQNCSNPLDVYTCPPTVLTGQSNAGMLDDAPSPQNVPGEDVVYRINTVPGTFRLYVKISNIQSATGINGKISLSKSTCTASPVISGPITGPNVSYAWSSAFGVSVGTTEYYLFLDFADSTTYDISFGADTGVVFSNTPNLQGLLEFDSCATNPFASAKKFLEVQYNAVYQNLPMTLSPLNVPGQMCIDLYLKNLTGVSGPLNVIFQFQKAGYSIVSPVLSTIPGFNSTGNWIYSSVLSSPYTNSTWAGFYYYYNNGTTPSKGDITGTPNSCLHYGYCFNITPLSNLPSLTNVKITIFSDQIGRATSTTQTLSCCASNQHASCNSIFTISGAGGTQGLTVAFDDPGGSGLPVSLLSFNGTNREEGVELTWATATEINNDYFSIERSKDGREWEDIGQISGNGNSSNRSDYLFTDLNPLKGTSYYRLKQTDSDGHYLYYEPIIIRRKDHNIRIYPVPAGESLYLESQDPGIRDVSLYDMRAIKIPLTYSLIGNTFRIPTSHIAPGCYFLEIVSETGERIHERIQVLH